MSGNITEPINARRFHGSIGVEALGDGAGDEGLALLGQPVQERTLLLDQPVDLNGLLIQESRNPPLRVEWGKRDEGVLQRILAEPKRVTPLAASLNWPLSGSARQSHARNPPSRSGPGSNTDRW